MARHPVISTAGKSLALVMLYVVLFVGGSRLLLPPTIRDAAPSDPAQQGAAFFAILACAVIDVALLLGIALTSRLRGTKLWLMLAGFFWFVKTFTSQLEAAYFMSNVSAQMAPALFSWTLPLCLGLPAALMALFGLWAADPLLIPAWRAPMGRTELALKLAALSVIVYPVLFFGAGYFIAWQSPAVRQFYSGSTQILRPAQHFATVFAEHPGLFPFEMLRGLLWVGAALPVLRTARGPAWLTTLLVALSFALIQNDLHLLNNPLMPTEVRHYHFLETASSNLVWGACIGWLLLRPQRGTPGGGARVA